MTLTACTLPVGVEPPESIDRPAGVSEIPAVVGIYYSPEFLTKERRVSVPGLYSYGSEYRIDVGQVSADYLDQVFLALFRDIRIVPQRPPAASHNSGLDAVIEPRIEAAFIKVSGSRHWSEEYVVGLVYRLNLYSPEGEPIASWSVDGSGKNTSRIELDIGQLPAEAMKQALDEVGNKILTDFAKVPEVRLWMQARGYAEVDQ